MLTPVSVVKVGGATVADEAVWSALAEAVRAGGSWVVVHGGGGEVTEWQHRLGLMSEWHNGLRVTTDADMDVVGMVLSGRVNKRVVSALVGAGCRAAGVSGEDDGMLRAEPSPELGRAGTISAVDARLLGALLSAGVVPVVSPVSRGPDGRSVNVNADDAACAIAAELPADRLLYLSDVPGVLDGGAVVPELDGAMAESALVSGTIAGGMAPKVRAALRAVAAGVDEVCVGDIGMLSGGGTRIRAGGTPAAATVAEAVAASPSTPAGQPTAAVAGEVAS
ncbi:MAG TPA: acetylglutamate kinase [Longimicrobiales bacterium]|nr:acetylglutamate kinase [Longimicrobiales bacterium]